MWSYFTDLYDVYIEKAQDPRVKDLPLMESPRTTLILITLYVLFVKFVGPAYMRNRKPFELRRIIIAYNAMQTIYSATVFLLASYIYGQINFNLKCMPQNYNTDYYSLMGVFLSWLFFVARFVEFFDTIFFILRKKDNQVTLLHVYHHAAVPLMCWVGVKIVPGGHYTLAGVLNVFVHTFMYFYYMLAAMGPQYKKYLWWKKYMTILQLGQFVIVILHTANTMVSDCEVNSLFGWLVLSQAVCFYKMFWDFYQEAFKTNKIKQK